MNRFKLGIVAESTGLPIRQTIEWASKWSVDGLQVDGVGNLSANALTETGRREIKNLLKSFNLELSAIGCPIRRGLDSPEELQKRLENIQKAMQLAYDLGARKVVVPFPKLPEPESPAALTLRDSLLALAACGDRVGTLVCLEAGLDDAAKVRDYLATYDTGSLCVNFDPANFLMNGHDPLASAIALSGKIAHSHARRQDDGRECPPRGSRRRGRGYRVDGLHRHAGVDRLPRILDRGALDRRQSTRRSVRRRAVPEPVRAARRKNSLSVQMSKSIRRIAINQVEIEVFP